MPDIQKTTGTPGIEQATVEAALEQAGTAQGHRCHEVRPKSAAPTHAQAHGLGYGSHICRCDKAGETTAPAAVPRGSLAHGMAEDVDDTGADDLKTTAWMKGPHWAT